MQLHRGDQYGEREMKRKDSVNKYNTKNILSTGKLSKQTYTENMDAV